MAKKRTVRVTDVDKALKQLKEIEDTVRTVIETLEDSLDGLTKAAPKKTPDPLHTPMKDVFMQWYKEQFGVEYVWSAAEAGGLNLLISKVKTLLKGKDQSPTDSWAIILENLPAADKWVYDNVSVVLINSKFNNLIAKMMMPMGSTAEIENYKKELAKRLADG